MSVAQAQTPPSVVECLRHPLNVAHALFEQHGAAGWEAAFKAQFSGLLADPQVYQQVVQTMAPSRPIHMLAS